MKIVVITKYDCEYCDKRFSFKEKAENHEKICFEEQRKSYNSLVKLLDELEAKCDCAEAE